ncbi:MAG: ABC transporter permease [Halolamina sp.]
MNDTGVDAGGVATFEQVDWDEYEASGHVVDLRTVGFLVAVGVLVAVFSYDYLVIVKAHSLPGGFDPSRLEWLSLLSVVVLAFYVVWPLAANRGLTLRYWRRLRKRPFALAAAAFLLLLTAAALLGPLLLDEPRNVVWTGEVPPRGLMLAQPPAFSSVEMTRESGVLACRGAVRDGRCFGTLAHPLGTTRSGVDVLAFLLYGARTTLQIALVTAVLLVPFATIVGTVAAYAGGWLDEVLMRYVDLQQVVPGFLAYLLYQYLYGPSLFVIVLLFGLLDWDRIARQVRGDALRKRGAGYVVAARSAGSTHLDTVRRHLVPNVADTVVSRTTLQIPFVLVAEVTLTFLGLVQMETASWGVLLKIGFGSRFRGGPQWWSLYPPLIALVVTIAAFAVFGDALRDVLNPRGGGQ